MVFIVKSSIAALAMKLIKNTNQASLLTGLALFQVGEFAFIVSKVGIDNDLLEPSTNQYFLSVSVVSMLITPFVIIFSERIAVKITGKSKPAVSGKGNFDEHTDEELPEEQVSNHLIIIGYGVNGRNLSKSSLLK